MNKESIEPATKLKSQENLERLEKLTEELQFQGMRLMVDPQKNTSRESVIEDICNFLEAEKNRKKSNRESDFSFTI